jgi:hypothetical protein
MPASFAYAVEIVARRLEDGPTKTQLLQLVGNYRRRAAAKNATLELLMQNRFSVGAVGRKIEINNLAPRPSLSAREALELAAWLVACASPLLPGDAAATLGQFHKLLGDAAEGTDLEEAARGALEE